MKPIYFKLCDGKPVVLNPTNDAHLQAYLIEPRSQVPEMIRQINAANYYQSLLSGSGGDKVFLDLGANLGLVSLWALPACRRVVAIEAEPLTFNFLCRLAKPYAPKFECVLEALADKTGPVKLSVDHTDFSCHTITNPKKGNPIVEVPGVTLIDLLAKHSLPRVDLCKIDVEGAEMAAVTEDVLSEAQVLMYYIEVHKTPTQSREQSLQQMLQRLKRTGFQTEVHRTNAIIAKRA